MNALSVSNHCSINLQRFCLKCFFVPEFCFVRSAGGGIVVGIECLPGSSRSLCEVIIKMNWCFSGGKR